MTQTPCSMRIEKKKKKTALHSSCHYEFRRNSLSHMGRLCSFVEKCRPKQPCTKNTASVTKVDSRSVFTLVFFFFKGKGQRGVYHLLFWSNGSIGQTRPREAPASAPDCPKFSSDALARCPQTLPSTHTFLFSFFEHIVGANGTASHEGS